MKIANENGRPKFPDLVGKTFKIRGIPTCRVKIGPSEKLVSTRRGGSYEPPNVHIFKVSRNIYDPNYYQLITIDCFISTLKLK